MALHVDPIPGVIGKPLTMTFMEGTNQRSGPDSSAQQASTQSLINDRLSANPSICIALMNSTTRGGTVSASQGYDRSGHVSTSNQGQVRIVYNNWAMNTATSVAARVDVASDANVGVIGAAPIRNGNYPITYFSDRPCERRRLGASGVHSIAAKVIPSS